MTATAADIHTGKTDEKVLDKRTLERANKRWFLQWYEIGEPTWVTSVSLGVEQLVGGPTEK